MYTEAETEQLIEALNAVPANLPWYILQWAYMQSALRRTKNNKTRTAKNIHMSLRSFRANIISSALYGFVIAAPTLGNPLAKERAEKYNR
jgi:hypothetical protein